MVLSLFMFEEPLSKAKTTLKMFAFINLSDKVRN